MPKYYHVKLLKFRHKVKSLQSKSTPKPEPDKQKGLGSSKKETTPYDFLGGNPKRSKVGAFEGCLIGLKRLRGAYLEDENIPVFFMDIPFVSPLSSHAVKMVVASQLDLHTLVLEIPDCYFTVEAW